jgi:cardiolipin synthase
MHVMFSMDIGCDLNLLYDICDFGEASKYLQNLINAAENGASIRLILKPQPTDGIESAVAYNIFVEELEKRGLRDRVEIRFFEDPIHYKTTLIDDQFLIVGSQNFHYSAFGQGEGLTEYRLGTDDDQAVADFKRLFEHQWASATQREE